MKETLARMLFIEKLKREEEKEKASLFVQLKYMVGR
jgi:hypothetical protein